MNMYGAFIIKKKKDPVVGVLQSHYNTISVWLVQTLGLNSGTSEDVSPVRQQA